MTPWSCVTRCLIPALAVFLTACASAPPSQTSSSSSASGGRYQMQSDSGLLEPIDLSKVKPVVPKTEKRTLAGNKNPYTVNGVTYHLLTNESGFSEIGMASWYGRKFHGHLTSNGEIYDMFQLSAAHTRLPIPSYVRVTNLDNGKSIIARVNDRGPFHPGRVVDLSYAGAVMLGYADKGTARVKVEALVPGASDVSAVSSAVSSGVSSGVSSAVNEAPEANAEPQASQPIAYATSSIESVATERKLIDDNTGREFLQIGAFSNLESAQRLVTRLSGMTGLPVIIASDANDSGTVLHKVRVGPLADNEDVQRLIDSVVNAQLGNPFKVRI